MIPKSLKEVIEFIERIVAEHLPEIITVEYTAEENVPLARDFPALYLIAEGSPSLNSNYDTVSLTMRFCDVMISQNGEWKKDYEIKSDMQLAASKLFQIVEDEGWLVDAPLTPEVLTGVGNDGLSGHQYTVNFIVEKPCLEEQYEPSNPTPEPITITITSPITGEEFEEGTDITVSYSLSTEEGVTDVALEIDGVETQRKTGIFDAFLISGLDVNSHSIVLKAYNGEELLATSNTVSVDVVQIPLILTILTPTEGAEYTEGDNVIVSYEFNREYTEVDEVEFWINGVKELELAPPTGAAFDAVAGEMMIEVRAVDVADITLANDVVNLVVEAAGPTYEQETIDYMTALAIPDDTDPSMYSGLSNHDVWVVVNNRFLGYKANGLMTELQAEWWMLGNTAAQHSFNALNPAAFQLTWFGGWVHSELGALGNGTNTYAATGFVPSNEQEVYNNGVSLVTGLDIHNLSIQIGSQNGGRQRTGIQTNSDLVYSLINGKPIGVENIDGRGIYSGSRQSDTLSPMFKNGIKTDEGISTIEDLGTLPTYEVYVGALNGGGSASLFSSQRIQNAAMHEGLSDAQIEAYHTIVDEFETALGRKTW